MQKDWSIYYSQTRNNPPSKLLTEAVAYVGENKVALDAGAGALKDTRFLLQQGFTVTAFDSDITFEKESKEIQSPHFTPIRATFSNFPYLHNHYSLVNCMNALPFDQKETFKSSLKSLKQSLAPGGILCMTLFGPNDEWNTPEGYLNFITLEEVRELLQPLTFHVLSEKEFDKNTAAGVMKHWDIISVIAQK